MKKRQDDTELLMSRHFHGSDDDDSANSLLVDEESGRSLAGGHDSFNPWPHVFNLANCIVGVSVLAMPFVFQKCGIVLAVVMIGLCSVLTKLTCHFLSKSSAISKRHSYESLSLAAFGSGGRRMVEITLLFFLVSSIVAFMVVIGDIGPHIVAEYLELEAPTSRLRILVMILVVLFVIFPLSLIKDLEKFSVVSSMAVLFYAAFVVRMLLEALPVLWEGKWSVNVVWWRPSGFLTCLPIVCMAMSCQTQLFSILESVRKGPDHVDLVVSNAVNFCSGMYAAVGLFGYIAFYSKELHGDVLVELESSWFTQMMKLAFMLSIAVSIPLMLFPARSAFFNLFLRPSDSEMLPTGALGRSTFHVLTSVLLLFNLFVAILIPNVEFILGLTGSLIGSLVSTIIPSLIFISLAGKKTSQTGIAVAKVCLVIGVFILLASTWATLESERRSTVVEKPMPKDSVVDRPALQSLERLEEKVLDSNLNISAKLDDIADMAAKGDQKEAARLIVEMKEQQKEQVELIKKQEQIVEELNKHVEKHKIANDETGDNKSITEKSKEVPAVQINTTVIPAAAQPIDTKELEIAPILLNNDTDSNLAVNESEMAL